jgi:hypothetical protein
LKLSHLTEIVKNVAAALKCPKCGKGFAGDTVDVVDITGDKGLFSAHCLHCNSATLVAMSVREFRQKISKREKQISKVAIGQISPADVVGLKNFLEDFDGDFRKILEQPEQKKKVE